MNVFLITVLISIIPLWELQNVLHELTHGLTIKLGWKWNFTLYPYPNTKLGRFCFASVLYEKVAGSKDMNDKDYGIVALAPKIMNLFFIILSSILACCFLHNDIAFGVLLVFITCNFIDFVFGILTLFRSAPKEGVDLWVFQKGFGYSIHILRDIGAVAISILGSLIGVLLILHFLW